jgi:hypothetical protein
MLQTGVASFLSALAKVYRASPTTVAAYRGYLVVFLIHWAISALLKRQLPPSLKPGISRSLSSR